MQRKVKKSIKKKPIIVGIVILLIITLMAAIGLKIIKISTLFAKTFLVQGVDVSHYQGEIDWEVLQMQNIDFAYIKATEGSSHVDEKFEENWKNASQTSLKIGAYHFFSFDSEGKNQAENYIRTVGNLEGKLIPVIDVEYYGDKFRNPPDKEKVVEELKDMCVCLEREYGAKPMLYTTNTVYRKYLKGEFDFEEYPLWIRDVYFTPDITIRDQWTIWQYSDTSILKGYSGEEKYIDMNVFHGDLEELNDLLVEGFRD